MAPSSSSNSRIRRIYNHSFGIKTEIVTAIVEGLGILINVLYLITVVTFSLDSKTAGSAGIWLLVIMGIVVAIIDGYFIMIYRNDRYQSKHKL